MSDLKLAIADLQRYTACIEDAWTHNSRVYYVELAEHKLAEIRAIIEAEPLRERMEQRYGTTQPKSVSDWWIQEE